jgi:hypothetical protein
MPRILAAVNGIGGTHTKTLTVSTVTGAQINLGCSGITQATVWADPSANVGLAGTTTPSGTNSVYVGSAAGDTTVAADNTVLIGCTARTYVASGVTSGVGIGYMSRVTSNGVCIGANATASGSSSIAIGQGVSATGSTAVAIGSGSAASANYTTALGRRATATHAGGVALGCDSTNAGAATTAINDFVLGTASHTVRAPGSLTVTGAVVGGATIDATTGFRHGSAVMPSWTTGTGSPEGAITAPVGSLYSRTDGGIDTTIYRKETGSGLTGWVPTAAAGLPPSAVDPNLYDANSILKADIDNTPVVLPVGFSTFVGRGASGTIAALTAAQAKTVLAITNTDVSGLGGLAAKTLIVDADVSGTAAIQLSKLAVDPLARANHTGTQLASTISDFDTQVRTNRLDQMAVPTATVTMGGQILSNLGAPAVGTDAATKAYVDAKVPATGATTKATALIGNTVATQFDVTHNFNSKDVAVEVYEVATGLTVLADITRPTVNTVRIAGFVNVPGNSAYSVVVIG